MRVPAPSGPLGERVVAALRQPPSSLTPVELPPQRDADDDARTLWTIHELHYRGFEDVDDSWEWAPALMEVRHLLETELEERLRRGFSASGVTAGADLEGALTGLVEGHDGPSLARHLLRHGSREQALELLRQRSVYHLKEADPTSWVIPRLDGRVKAALVEIQFDEYGAGRADRVHHDLFAKGLRAAGLNPGYGHYVDRALLPVMEQSNAVSMFGLHRRLRGAALGHLAAFEATSSLPSRVLSNALGRLELPEEIVAYYDEHVEADAVHEQLALREVCLALVEDEPDLSEDILLGAWTCLELEARTARALLSSWAVA